MRIERAVEGVAQQHQRLGSHLRDARVGDAEIRGDVGHRALGEEVVLDHLAQPLGQLGDRLQQVGEPLLVLHELLGGGSTGGDQLVERGGGRALQREHLRPADVLVVGGHLLHAHPECGGDLGDARRAAQHAGQPAAGLLEVAGPTPHRPGGPVDGAQLVENRAPDARGGVPLERNAALGVERLGSLDESGEACGGQVVTAHMGWHPAHRLPDDMSDQRHVAGDEFVGAGVACVLGHGRKIACDPSLKPGFSPGMNQSSVKSGPRSQSR
jgi:hypothetical protein